MPDANIPPTQVLRRIHVVAHDCEGSSGWWWLPTKTQAEAVYAEEVGIWGEDGHVRLLTSCIPQLPEDHLTTNWIEDNAAPEDFTGWTLLERHGPMPSGMTDPHGVTA